MAARWPNLAPRGGQDDAKMAQDGACLANLAPFWGAFWTVFEILGAKSQIPKNHQKPLVFKAFWGLGGSGWRLLGLSWGILARSWAILGDLGVKLGPCWQDVGTKMSKMSRDSRT